MLVSFDDEKLKLRRTKKTKHWFWWNSFCILADDFQPIFGKFKSIVFQRNPSINSPYLKIYWIGKHIIKLNFIIFRVDFITLLRRKWRRSSWLIGALFIETQSSFEFHNFQTLRMTKFSSHAKRTSGSTSKKDKARRFSSASSASRSSRMMKRMSLWMLRSPATREGPNASLARRKWPSTSLVWP